MNRVLIIGCPGSGKTTLARALGEKTGLPVIHLDQHYWLPNWTAMENSAWLRTVEELIARPRWVMDGNYGGTLTTRIRAADTVVFLDFPRWLCLFRVFQRTLRWHGQVRSELPAGCPERLDREFFAYVWRYRRNSRPRVLDALRNCTTAIVTLRARERFVVFSTNGRRHPYAAIKVHPQSDAAAANFLRSERRGSGSLVRRNSAESLPRSAAKRSAQCWTREPARSPDQGLTVIHRP